MNGFSTLFHRSDRARGFVFIASLAFGLLLLLSPATLQEPAYRTMRVLPAPTWAALFIGGALFLGWSNTLKWRTAAGFLGTLLWFRVGYHFFQGNLHIGAVLHVLLGLGSLLSIADFTEAQRASPAPVRQEVSHG